MRADNGDHAFTYAFTGWEGSFSDAPVVREAYRLNVPLQVAAGSLEAFSAFSLDAENVFIDTVKPAEDGSGDVVLRCTRPSGAIPDAAEGGRSHRIAWACNMLEGQKNNSWSRRSRASSEALEVVTDCLRTDVSAAEL
jgi:alpha-mannosidase